MDNDGWEKHRDRWMKRIRQEQRKASRFENAIHYTLDAIDDGESDIKKIEEILMTAFNHNGDEV